MTLTATWLLTIAVHGGVLLLVAWGIDRVVRLRCAWRELMWRTALFGCVLSATLQVAAVTWPLGARLAGADSALSSLHNAEPVQQMIYGGAAPLAESRPLVSSSSTSNPSAPARIATAAAAPSRMFWLPSSAVLLAGIVGIWMLGALFALSRFVLSLAHLRRRLAAATTLVDDACAADLSMLAQQAGIAQPRLLTLAAIPSPIAAWSGRIVLPTWAIQTLDQSQLQAMLAHELAHIARSDPAWKLLTAFWRALFWFVPMTNIAQRRLEEIAELSCDAFAAEHTGSGQRLAECLAVCAEHHVSGRHAFALAPAMAARQSSLLHRIERLLEGVSMETTTSGARAHLVALVVVLASAAALPAIGFDTGTAHAAQTSQPAQAAKQSSVVVADDADHTSISIHDDANVEGSLNGHDMMSVSHSDGTHKFKANVDGKIDFNDEETDVSRLSSGGTARFDETQDGVTERVELAERGGKIERRYFVNGTEQPFDDKARVMMATAVKEMMRSGIGAEARAKRLYAKGGAKLVLDEIDQIHSDYSRGIYLKLLAGMAKLTPDELDHSLKIAGAMKSDYERRQALSALFDRQALDPARQITFLQQAMHFDSDYERAELLVGVVPRLADSDAVRQAWLQAALGVHSDYERRRTLEAMLTHGGLNDAQLGSVIEASGSMSSDYEHRELLVTAARRAHDIDALAPAYTRSAQGLHSDYEHREALLALIYAGKLGPKSVGAVLDSAAQIKSSYECREVLVALARVMPSDASLVERYRDVAKRLSDSDRGEAERALVL